MIINDSQCKKIKKPFSNLSHFIGYITCINCFALRVKSCSGLKMIVTFAFSFGFGQEELHNMYLSTPTQIGHFFFPLGSLVTGILIYDLTHTPKKMDRPTSNKFLLKINILYNILIYINYSNIQCIIEAFFGGGLLKINPL